MRVEGGKILKQKKTRHSEVHVIVRFSIGGFVRMKLPRSLAIYKILMMFEGPHCKNLCTLSDIIITDFIVTDTSFHGHNYSRSTVSEKFFIFRTVNTNLVEA